MDTKLQNRDHAVTPAGRPYFITGSEELMQRVLIRLTVPRGRFSPDPALGSRLYRMPRGSTEQMESYARYAIEEALCGLEWVRLESVTPTLSPRRRTRPAGLPFRAGRDRSAAAHRTVKEEHHWLSTMKSFCA